MDDMISRAAAIRAALRWYVNPDGGVFNAIKANIRSNLEQVPAVDAVPVVRCKDCKFRDVTGPYPICWYDSADPCERNRNADEDDWFCADGERREATSWKNGSV